MERPEKFRVQRKGMFVDAELIFDKKTLTLHGKKANVYAQIKSPMRGIYASLRQALIRNAGHLSHPRPGTSG